MKAGLFSATLQFCHPVSELNQHVIQLVVVLFFLIVCQSWRAEAGCMYIVNVMGVSEQAQVKVKLCQ